MKNKIWMLLIAVGIFFTSACETKKANKADEKNVITVSEVPAPVQTAFKDKYPSATDVIWEDAHENDDPTIKAKFVLDGKDKTAEFKMDGTLVKES